MGPKNLSVILALLPLTLASTSNYADTVTLTGGTLVPVELIENVNSSLNRTGEKVYMKVTTDVKVGDNIVIPKGAPVVAKIGTTEQRGMMGKGGDLDFYPSQVAAIDGQWVSVDKENFGAGGAGAGAGAIIGIGLFAKGKAAYVLRGTEYEVTIRRDTEIDTEKVQPLRTVKKADFSVSAKFHKIDTIKFSKGRPGDPIVMEVALTPEIASLVCHSPAAVEIVSVLDNALEKPINPITVDMVPKKNLCVSTFDWWKIIRYSQPGSTPMIVQLKLSDGKVAQAEATLESTWKLP